MAGVEGLRPGYGIQLESAVALLRGHTPVAAIEPDWPAGRVRISAYLGHVELPSEIPHRVRCLVTDGQNVLVTWDKDGNPDAFPGGGAEPGETIAETAAREVWEETGWNIDPDSIVIIGWVHVETLSFVDPGATHTFPHPDGFMTVVRVSPIPVEHEPRDWRDVDGFIASSAFVSIRELPSRVLEEPVSRAFLDAGLGPGWLGDELPN